MSKKSNQSPNELKEIIARLEKSETQLKAANQQLEAINQDLIASEKSALNREEKYRLLAENISDVIWVYNIDKQIFTYISPSVFQLRGYTVDEAIAQTFTESLIPDDAEKINKLFISRSATLKKGIAKIYTDELQQTCKDGTSIWVEIVTTPQKAKDGRNEILGVSRNINDRKKSEHEQQLTNEQLRTSDQELKASNQQLSASESTLKISEERYKGIIDHTFNCIAIYKPIDNGNNFVIIDFNKSAEKLENIVKEDIIGKKVTDVFPGIEKFGLLDIFKKVTKTGNPQHFPISFYEDDKIEGYRENYVFILSTGELIAVYQDVTERVDAKQELQLEKDKLTSIFESMDDGVYLINKNYDIEYINPILRKEFGPIDNKKCFEYFHDANKPCSFCKNKDVFNGKTVQWEWTSIKNNKTYDLIDSPVYNADGSISKLEIFRDITNRKKAENEISKLSTAVEQSPSVIAISDLVGNVEYVNPKFTELTGYSKDEILNHNLRILKSGEQSEENYAKLWKTIKSGKAWQGEFHNKKKNGELFWEAATISPIFDKNGKIINYLKVAENITERKEAEKELLKLSFAVEQSPSVIAITDLVGNIEYVNPKFTELTGYSLQEARDSNPRILKSGEQPDEVYSELWKTISQGKAWKGEFHNKKKNGELFWESAAVSPIFDKKGEIINYLKVAEDITIRKKAEEELKASEEKYRELIDTTSEGFWLLDSKNITIDINKALCDMLDYSRDEIIGKKPLDFTDKENKNIFKEQLSKSKELKHRYYDISLQSKSGKNIPTLFNATSLIGENGEYNGSFAFVTNISKRKKNEQDLNIALYNATESDRLKSAFLATISHELRTPLNAIIGFASLINKELETDDILEFANTIKSSGNHLLNIVNEIFDITLIESGKSIISKQNVNLNSTLNNIYSTIKAEQNLLKKDNIDVNIIIPPESSKLIVNTDPFKVKQILINLLKNALKFTNKGHIYYGYVSDVINNKAVIKFFVRDTGIGIPKDKQEYIFGMFKQIDDSYTRTYGGIGIGLSISKKLTELLGGNIWFESKEGVGSTFYFTIPKDIITKSNKSIVKSPISEINLTDKTILIVEDDIDSYEYLKIVLNLYGANIIWAQDGEESIDICKQNSSIDIVLMDINMKVMNGYIATQEIKKFRPNLPIIAQTALAISGDHKKAIDAGCDDYITKPIKKEDLTKMIHKQLNC